MLNIFFGVKSKDRCADKLIGISARQSEVQWLVNNNSKSNYIDRTFEYIDTREAIKKFKMAGTCAIVAIINDEDYDNSFFIILIPNRLSKRCNIYAVHQESIFREEMYNYDINDFMEPFEMISKNPLFHRIFLLSKVKFLTSANASKVSSWDTVLGLDELVSQKFIPQVG